MVACIVNVIGDLILVAGFHLDAAGADIKKIPEAGRLTKKVDLKKRKAYT